MRNEDVVLGNSKVMNGTLVFKGTLVPVEILIQHLAAGTRLKSSWRVFDRDAGAGSRLPGDHAGSGGCACCSMRTCRGN